MRRQKFITRPLVEFGMRHSQVIILLVVLLVAFGVAALVRMPKQEFPIFSIRQGLVVGIFPGANSEQVEKQLTTPLEDFLYSYKEVNKEDSYSITRDGMVIMVVQLHTDVESDDEFWSKFRHDLDNFKHSLPSGVAGIFTNNDFGQTSALLISIESKDKTYRELESYLDELETRLRGISSVSNLREYGIQKEQISVYLDRNKLIKYGINSASLYGTLFAQNFTTVSGEISNNQELMPIHVSETFNSENDVAEQIIYTSADGDFVRLRDVARIVREYPEPISYIANGDKKCVLLSIEMRDGRNIVAYGKEVKKVISDFEKTLPEEVTIFRVADQSQVVSNSVNTFLREMLVAICTVILVILLLQPFRVAAIAALTIPITIFISVGLLYLFGYELNTVTLAGLLVVLGIIVDDSIVVIDNYVDKLDHGIPRWEASIRSSTELFKSVLSATLAITITFYPFLHTCTGMFREFLDEFPGTITVTLFISLLVAILVIPFLQYSLIRQGYNENKRHKKINLAGKMQNAYNKVIHIAFRFPKTTIGIALGALGIGLLVYVLLPQKMMPVTERNQFVVEIYMPSGFPLSHTANAADTVASILRRDKRVTNVTEFIGSSAPRFHTCYAPAVASSRYAMLIVTTTSNETTNEVLDDYMNKYIDCVPNAMVRLKQLDYIFSTFPIEVRLTGTDMASLQQVKDEVGRMLRTRDDLLMITDNTNEVLPGVAVDINSVEANRIGISKTSVMANLALNYSNGLPLTVLWEDNYPLSVNLKMDDEHNKVLTDISDEYISTMAGEAVPLHQVADISPDFHPCEIVKRNGEYCVSVYADVKRHVNVANTTESIRKMLKNNLQLPSNVKLTLEGSKHQDDILMPQIMFGLLLSVLIIFMVLLFHFKKISLTLLILGAASLAIFGGAVGIGIMGMEYTLTSLLGLVALMGIIVRNGIIMYDYAEDLRQNQGKSVYEAALEAGKRRMRPIFLTSAAASMGVITMIISQNALWAPMATVICFGTWISMMFVVTVLPVSYWLLFRNQDETPSSTVPMPVEE